MTFDEFFSTLPGELARRPEEFDAQTAVGIMNDLIGEYMVDARDRAVEAVKARSARFNDEYHLPSAMAISRNSGVPPETYKFAMKFDRPLAVKMQTEYLESF